MWPERFYLTGTDTDVGKTISAALLCAALDLDYWKPVQAGLDDETDSELVARLSGVRVHPERWRLKRAASPHAAAEDEGQRVQLSDFELPDAQRLLVEGAGGYQVPYADHPLLWQGDLIGHLQLPVVVVARSGLGTLNHTLLTLRALRADGHDVVGLLLVGAAHFENQRDLEAMGGVPILARLPMMDDVAQEFDDLVARLRLDWGRR
jgi:dethiobiotin synthetase